LVLYLWTEQTVCLGAMVRQILKLALTQGARVVLVMRAIRIIHITRIESSMRRAETTKMDGMKVTRDAIHGMTLSTKAGRI